MRAYALSLGGTFISLKEKYKSKLRILEESGFNSWYESLSEKDSEEVLIKAEQIKDDETLNQWFWFCLKKMRKGD